MEHAIDVFGEHTQLSQVGDNTTPYCSCAKSSAAAITGGLRLTFACAVNSTQIQAWVTADRPESVGRFFGANRLTPLGLRRLNGRPTGGAAPSARSAAATAEDGWALNTRWVK